MATIGMAPALMAPTGLVLDVRGSSKVNRGCPSAKVEGMRPATEQAQKSSNSARAPETPEEKRKVQMVGAAVEAGLEMRKGHKRREAGALRLGGEGTQRQGGGRRGRNWRSWEGSWRIGRLLGRHTYIMSGMPEMRLHSHAHRDCDSLSFALAKS